MVFMAFLQKTPSPPWKADPKGVRASFARKCRPVVRSTNCSFGAAVEAGPERIAEFAIIEQDRFWVVGFVGERDEKRILLA